MVKVLFIAYYFPPVGGAGVQRAQKFVQYLPSHGFLPVVLTGSGGAEGRWTPHDKTLMDTIPPEVPVYRTTGELPGHVSNLRRRLETWLALPSSSSKPWIRAALETAGKITEKLDLIFATMSPFASGEIASEVAKSLGIPWVADLRDPWALDEMQIYSSLLHRKVEMRRMERVLSTASLIIMNTPEASKALKEAFPRLTEKKILTITNGFDCQEFSGPVRPRNDTKFRIVHSGYLHTSDGVLLRNRRFQRLLGGAEPGVDILTRSHVVLLEAVARWRSQRPAIGNDVEIVFAGQTSAEDRALVEVSPVASLVHFTGYLSHTESLSLIRTADLLFLPMHNLPPHKRSRIVPGKTYEYIATGRPILAAVPEGDAKDFLSQCGTALICRPDDVDGMVQVLDQIYSAWSKNEQTRRRDETFVSQFERRTLASALAGAFDSVLPHGRTISPQPTLVQG